MEVLSGWEGLPPPFYPISLSEDEGTHRHTKERALRSTPMYISREERGALSLSLNGREGGREKKSPFQEEERGDAGFFLHFLSRVGFQQLALSIFLTASKKISALLLPEKGGRRVKTFSLLYSSAGWLRPFSSSPVTCNHIKFM